jgi:glycosyltransferase involved in cell wall biosynthesis
VLDYYRRSDVLFLPSLSEGLPVVGVQAMAMGLALVLSRVGGSVDLVQGEENGALVESGDAAGFTAALGACWAIRRACWRPARPAAAWRSASICRRWCRLTKIFSVPSPRRPGRLGPFFWRRCGRFLAAPIFL